MQENTDFIDTLCLFTSVNVPVLLELVGPVVLGSVSAFQCSLPQDDRCCDLCYCAH